MPLISATRLRIRSIWFLPAFFLHAKRSTDQVKTAEGNLAAALLNDAQWTFWTCTAWESAEQMRAYMTSGGHMAAMRKLIGWCDEASVAHWEQDSPELPSWTEIHRRMQADGRASKVAHPSAAHLANTIAPPHPTKARSFKVK